MTPTNCIRKMVIIHGERYYLIAGDKFIHVTCPRENDPNMSREREAMEILCQEYNNLMAKEG